jgi:hypothetical protein
MNPWKLHIWSLYDQKHESKLAKLARRLTLHKSILYEFTSQEMVETSAGKTMKILGLMNSEDPDISSVYDSCMDNVSFLLTNSQSSGYEDVFAIDEGMLESIESPKRRESDEVYVFELYFNGLYRGHVYGYWYEKYPNNIVIYGIRSSIINTLVSNCSEDRKGIGARLLANIIHTMQPGTSIFVKSPLPAILPTLTRLGFQETPTVDQGKFLQYAKIDPSNFWVYSGMPL